MPDRQIDSGPDPEGIARAYYAAIDEGRYDDLGALLDPEFVQNRPDMTLEGSEEFVRFMREERPLTDTTHETEGVYRNGSKIAVRGRLRHDGAALFAFLDVHTIENGRLAHLRTYTAVDESEDTSGDVGRERTETSGSGP